MTVERLAATLTVREFMEWRWYDALEGLPDRRADWRAGMIASTLANVHRKKGAKPFTPRDFMPREPAAAPKPATPGAEARVASFLEALGARADRPRGA